MCGGCLKPDIRIHHSGRRRGTACSAAPRVGAPVGVMESCVVTIATESTGRLRATGSPKPDRRAATIQVNVKRSRNCPERERYEERDDDRYGDDPIPKAQTLPRSGESSRCSASSLVVVHRAIRSLPTLPYWLRVRG